MPASRSLLTRYKLRLRRKRMLWRAFRSRHNLMPVSVRTGKIARNDILVFVTVRNEMQRLPWFLKHYRRLGVGHFLIVDNGSDDGTADYLRAEPDVSLWQTRASYKASRFGMDWITWLQRRYAHGHWTVTVDADELLIYPGHDTRDLCRLTADLMQHNQRVMGAIMLDLYPKGPPDAQSYDPEQDPVEVLPWFDAWGYQAQIQPKMGNLWLQGGPRARCFFSSDPRRAPTMNKIPLVYWDRSYAYVNSTHNLLPPALNQTWDVQGREALSGALLHTKFLPGSPARARREKARAEHFTNSKAYDDYYDAVAQNPDMWEPQSTRLTGWRQLVELGLMTGGDGDRD